ncbi:MAG: helix-turn-helix domain-containing protein [Betaproteobacteria bacterium]|nr:helix-turn-helix domain-containing protein [Betaproteobacteria bacterium]
MSDKKKPHTAGTGTAPKTTFDSSHLTPPIVTGLRAEVLGLIRQFQLVLSFVLAADHAIPEAAARVHELRAMGFNIRTTILPEVEFCGVIRRNAAQYSLGSPELQRPGFFEVKGSCDAD